MSIALLYGWKSVTFISLLKGDKVLSEAALLVEKDAQDVPPQFACGLHIVRWRRDIDKELCASVTFTFYGCVSVPGWLEDQFL